PGTATRTSSRSDAGHSCCTTIDRDLPFGRRRMSASTLLRIDGAVARPLALTLADLDAVPEAGRVLDVSRFHPKRRGDGVSLDVLLRQAGPRPEANYVTLHAERDDFHVSVPLDAL